jgi:hypothetical protein
MRTIALFLFLFFSYAIFFRGYLIGNSEWGVRVIKYLRRLGKSYNKELAPKTPIVLHLRNTELNKACI